LGKIAVFLSLSSNKEVIAMQLATLDRTVTSSGIGTQQKMGMVLDGTAFRILSDGLYSDKIGSLVRETYSNTIDSHIMAGQPTKAGWIQVPNSLDPTYIVRDEGIGLDEEGVMTTATTYFGSTKRSDNAAIGGFGLGFKSPFAYCDQWTIVSIKDGISRTFSAYMNEEGEPNVALLTEEITLLPNGLEVRVPVKQHDLAKFREAIAEQLQYFEPRPILSNSSGIEWPTHNVTLQGPNYALLASGDANRYYHESKWTALIGPVGFPIDKAQLKGDLSPRAASLLDGTSGRLSFEVGDISPAPSRENLQYNPKTVKAICALLDEVAEGFAKKFETDIASAPNFFSATGRFATLRNGLNQRLHGVIDSVTYQGKTLKKNFYLENSVFPGVHYYTFDSNDLRKDRFTLRNESQNGQVNPNDRTFIMIDDLPNANCRQAARLKNWFENDAAKAIDRVIMIRPHLNGATDPQTIIDSMGGFPAANVFKMTDLPPPAIIRATVSNAKSAKTLPGIRLVRRGSVPTRVNGKYDLDYCSSEVSGAVTPGFYIRTEHCIPQGVGDREQMLRLVDALPGEVHFVPQSIINRVVGEPGWIEFSTAFVAAVNARKAETLKALKRSAEIDAHGGSAINYALTRFLNTLCEAKVKAPARAQSAFWKLYRWYSETRANPLSKAEDMLVNSALASREDWVKKAHEEASDKSGASAEALVRDFRKGNPSLSEVVDDHRIGLSGDTARELATKLA
jgi:hypothetical protein